MFISLCLCCFAEPTSRESHFEAGLPPVTDRRVSGTLQERISSNNREIATIHRSLYVAIIEHLEQDIAVLAYQEDAYTQYVSELMQQHEQLRNRSQMYVRIIIILGSIIVVTWVL